MRDVSAITAAVGEPPLITVKALAQHLSWSPTTIRGHLSKQPGKFSAPRYARDGQHPRKVRLLTAHDARTLGLMRMATLRMCVPAPPRIGAARLPAWNAGRRRRS